MLPSYWASILCQHSLHVSSLYTGYGRASGRKLVGEDPLSSLRPPTTCVNAYLVLCPPCGDLLAYDHTSIFQRSKNNNKKENSCIEWKNVWGLFAKFAVRSPGVASFFFLFLSFFFSSLGYYCFLTVSHCFIWHYLQGKVCRCRKVQLSLTACIDE